MTNDSYEDLAERAERGEFQALPGTIRRGDDAAASGRAALLAATGADSIEDATRIALGRPRVGQEKSVSTVWKVRASTDLDTLATQLAEHEGINRSTLIRKAVAEYVTAHAN